MQNKTVYYIGSIQKGENIELHNVFHDGRVCVTKRTKIGNNGFVCPNFLREINVLQRLTKPPPHLANHPGRKHVIKILEVYVSDGYLHFDLEVAENTLLQLKNVFNVSIIKEKILIDVSNALQFIHECGFGHYDLSLSNIVYTKDRSDYGSIMYKFILIDLGNSVHKDRPFTLESPTYYTTPIEVIDCVQQIHAVHNIIRKKQINTADIWILQSYLKTIKLDFVHKKSDVWSLGSLSYYLHYFNYYADGDTLEEQKQIILEKTNNNQLHTKNDTDFDGHSEVLTKTKMMLITDSKFRPTLYFSVVKSHDVLKNTENRLIITDKKRLINDREIYKMLIKNIITGIKATTGKKLLIDVFNELLEDCNHLNNIVEMCYSIEQKHIKTLLNKTLNMLSDSPKLEIVNLLCFIRTVILWLVTHMFCNDVWSMTDIVKFLSYDIKDKNCNVRKMVEQLCLVVCESINWCFEF